MLLGDICFPEKLEQFQLDLQCPAVHFPTLKRTRSSLCKKTWLGWPDLWSCTTRLVNTKCWYCLKDKIMTDAIQKLTIIRFLPIIWKVLYPNSQPLPQQPSFNGERNGDWNNHQPYHEDFQFPPRQPVPAHPPQQRFSRLNKSSSMHDIALGLAGQEFEQVNEYLWGLSRVDPITV